jgi:hypothetical protein
MKRSSTVVFFAGIVIIGVLLYFTQNGLSRVTGTQWQQESLTYLPQGDRIKPALLGFETTVAHYLWIRTVIYFGGHRMTDNNYQRLVDMLDNITRLCPWFYPAYEFAGLIVPDVCNNPGAARILLERGMTYLGATKWNLAFHAGVICIKYYDDRSAAARYIARAAMVPGAPREKLVSMANAFYSQSGQFQEGLAFLYFAYENSDNPEVRRQYAEKILKLQQAGGSTR